MIITKLYDMEKRQISMEDKMIKNIAHDSSNNNNGLNDKNEGESSELPSWFIVPYVPRLTDKFKQFNRNNIKVAYYSANKLRKYIKVHKDPLDYMSKTNVVYKINCNDCDASYVGQTGRKLKTRIAEHRNHIRWNTSSKSVITDHRLEQGHEFDWNNVQILDEEPCYGKRIVAEMLNIKKQQNSLNLQTDTLDLHEAYIPIINKI
ncbi:PREDICTED: uncharacterized protein LOC108772348 [Cyphomyrmex costatus]|uniref:uncharacterized protein LOC108772348 n=1 Tax=Cyphomyrmex costatus TaxID=456900 RepID=UPI0008521F56|nr:PREDICTED: uncharacterized protein LOC108772348 [Cyphomyrmex costatus]